MPIKHIEDLIQLSLLSIKLIPITLLLSVFSVQAGETVSATVLYFDEVEAGVEPYTTRYIIGDGIIRIDEGRAEDSFVLFNAKVGVLYSVTRSDRSIFKIPVKEKLVVTDLQKRFARLHTRIELVNNSAAPKIAGLQALEYELKVGLNICARFSAVKGLLADELKLLQAYESALIANNTHNIGNQPAEYITDCMLANELYAADLYLKKGFPIVFKQSDGLQRFLKNYSSREKVDASLFELPKAYNEFMLEERIGL